MQDRQDLEQRVHQLESELASMRRAQPRGIRKRADWEILGLPAYDIALGPDPARGEMRGHARGFVATGDMATGVLALGGLSLGLLLAVGGCDIGNVALGGGALGRVAIGGDAVGVYAMGGGAAGLHVLSPARQDPEAIAFFGRFGIQPPPRQRRGG